MPKKKKTLPKDFEAMLKTLPLEELKKVFDTCELEAVGEYAKQTTLAYDDCPHELAVWLIAQGADVQKTDKSEYTPLHRRSGSYTGNIESLIRLGADIHATTFFSGTPLHQAAGKYIVKNVRVLLENGALVDALNRDGYTPLELALVRCNNVDIANAVELSKVLLHANAKLTPRMKELVVSIGEKFEFHRANINPEFVEGLSNALDELYKIYDVPAVAKRIVHDGQSTIIVKSENWQDQHEELWKLLVPSSGPAQTIQGEVIRIAGKISREMETNGGANWDDDYKKMADVFYAFVLQGQQLPDTEISELTALINDIKRGKGNVDRLTELGVIWVLKNPSPIKLPEINYKR